MENVPHIRIKNWKDFQHFKDRSPPWIKLYRENLYRRDIMMLSDRNFKILICLWMLASEDKKQDGNLPPFDDIAFKLRLPVKEIIKSIQDLKEFLVFDDIKMISSVYQDDAPETETETETETEGEGTQKQKKAKSLKSFFGGEEFDIPQDWGDMAYGDGLNADEINWHWKKFKNYWLAASGSKSAKKDWKRTWQNWYMQELEIKKRRVELNGLYTKK